MKIPKAYQIKSRFLKLVDGDKFQGQFIGLSEVNDDYSKTGKALEFVFHATDNGDEKVLRVKPNKRDGKVGPVSFLREMDKIEEKMYVEISVSGEGFDKRYFVKEIDALKSPNTKKEIDLDELPM